MKKKIFAAGLLLFLCSFSSFSQSHLSIPIDDPVYHVLRLGVLKGSLSRLSSVKPYTRENVLRYLHSMNQSGIVHSESEQEIIASFIEQFSEFKDGVRNGNIGYSSGSKSVYAGLNLLSNFRLNTENPQDWHMQNVLTGYVLGDISKYFSFYGSFGFTYDRVGFSTYAPYLFTKEWDAFHLGFGEPRYSNDGSEDVPYFSYQLYNDLAFEFLGSDLTFHVARYRRQWGNGVGDLSLGNTARPFLGVDAYARVAPWIGFGNLVGSLANWDLESHVKAYDSALSFQKMYTLQILEFFPTDWLYLSAESSIIWGKRFELGYMAPLLYATIYQNLIGDFDNAGQEISFQVVVPPFGSLYGSIFIDEMEFASLNEMLNRPRNMLAYQVGLNVPIPKLPFTVASFQYTKIEPFVYAHYPENYPFYTNPVDMSYSHDNENIGYYLAPNSDEILVKLETLPLYNFGAGLTYRLIRHGTNDPELSGNNAIYGDIDIPIDYSILEEYPDKDFLSDGYYDWNNIITLEAFYTFKKFPITLSFEYTFSHTFWVENGSGISAPANPNVRNIFSIQVELWPKQ